MKKTLLFSLIFSCLLFSAMKAQDWGASPDGDKTSVLGDWNISEDSIYHNTLVMTTPDPNRLFYRGSEKLANYTVKADIRLLEMKTEGAYPKYGFFPAYKDTANWIWVFIHPMETENGISVFAVIDNVNAIAWETFEWGSLDIDYTANNELEIEKAGNSFTVSVNGTEKANFEAAIDSAWVGLSTDAVRVSYKNFSLVDNDDHTAVQNNVTTSEVNVYPNPATEEILVESQTDSPISAIEIFSMSGQKIFTSQPNRVNTLINITSLKSGLYLFRVTTDKGTIVKKIQVSH